MVAEELLGFKEKNTIADDIDFDFKNSMIREPM